ncbi:MAG: hypothetical protein HKN32_02970 [Flavobacteriales bacterium]|nr:hypothetical protein [Flavobacteriales bacterium]
MLRGYYQLGEDRAANDLQAFMAGVDLSYSTDGWKLLIGAEILSGNDTVSDGKNNAFNPLFGTNHKFNGLMDYFYVGNHIDNAGLQDLYFSVSKEIKEKSKLSATAHHFSTMKPFSNDVEQQLGAELDVVFIHKINKDVIVKAGYSQLFATEGMEVLKNNTDRNTNVWGWVMLVVKPNLFNSSSSSK